MAGKRLCEALKEHNKREDLSCHMPGHKGYTGTFLGEVLKYDITETEGMDNLHDASGVILESERYAAALYGSEETHYLINGSTVGILSAILALTAPGDEILIARNCHKSVYNAVLVNRLLCRYVYPESIKSYGLCGGISIKSFRDALLRFPGVKVAVITSPTYEGIDSDVKALSQVAHENGVILIVDAAHGAHFGFYEGLPESAVSSGADIVINSVHKTLPAPTQTALIHINGPLVDREAVRRMLKIYQSSSPSYLLMAGIDDCMNIVSGQGNELFGRFIDNIAGFEAWAGQLKHLKHVSRGILKKECNVFDSDPGKIVISTENAGITGKELYDELLGSYSIEPEMAVGPYCLLIMTIMDDSQDFDRIKNALKCIDEKIGRDKPDKYEENKPTIYLSAQPEQVMQAYEAVGGNSRKVKLDKSQGLISADYIMPYPPGIPLLVPGERINGEQADMIMDHIEQGIRVFGVTKDKEVTVYG